MEFYHIKAEFNPQFFERTLSDMRFIYWIKGNRSELKHVLGEFIDERYEEFFYFVELDEDNCYLIASTVPLKLSFIPTYAKRFKSKRKLFLKTFASIQLSPVYTRTSILFATILGLTYIGYTILLVSKDFAFLFSYLVAFFLDYLLKNLGFVESNDDAIRVSGRMIVKKKKIKEARYIRIGIVTILIVLALYRLKDVFQQDLYAMAGVSLLFLFMFSPLIVTFLWWAIKERRDMSELS
ncbi:MAG: hypothetical protein H0Z18_00665 [Thermococcus sp.]|uniref:hypothetical protein n=1 Tax=Thermococcus sp. TaxID=35749 RepID=UPI001DE132F2|nr:hypothetical protein [Thermococcus sp.]MBO8173748.1 hypothetical protein [Thermococcus sp.]